MIYVIEEDAGGQANARNKHIRASAERDRGKKYGQIVTSKAEVVERLEAGDKTLCIYAHGNQQVVGRFRDMGALADHLKTQLGAFDVRKGKSIQNIVLNSCVSEDPASNLRNAVRDRNLVAGRDLAVIGTQDSAFTDESGAIRVAKGVEASKTLDDAVAANMQADRFYALINLNCYAEGEGIETFRIK